MDIAKISAKGQVSIPRTIREAAHLTVGDHIGFEMRDHEIVLIPILGRSLADLRGAWRTDALPHDLSDFRVRHADALAKNDQESVAHD